MSDERLTERDGSGEKTHNMDHHNQHEAADRALGILAHQNCRFTLFSFKETTEDVMSVRDLATRIASKEETDETMVQLHQSTIPWLADAGIVEYDSRSDAVRYHGDRDVEELLDAVTDCFAGEEKLSEVGH